MEVKVNDFTDMTERQRDSSRPRSVRTPENIEFVVVKELIPAVIKVLCWLVEQGLTSHSTQFRSFRRRCFYRSDDPTNSVKALKEGG